MANNDLFGGFAAISDSFSGKVSDPNNSNVSGVDDYEVVDPSEIFEDDELNQGLPDKDKKVIDKKEVDDSGFPDPPDDIADDLDDKKKTKDVPDELKDDDGDITDDSSADAPSGDLGESEPEITAYVQEKLFEKFGWELNTEDEKLTSIDSLADYLTNLVEENSKPSFANDEIKALNEFVTNGGKLEDYFKSTAAGVDVNSVDIDEEVNQVAVLKEYFKVQGVEDDKIKKRIDRYRDTGVLEEEAGDALELLKKHRAQEQQKLLMEQQNLAATQAKTQQKFINDVKEVIDSLDTVGGVKVTPAEKAKLMPYIFKPEADGKPKYQKDYSENPAKNLVQSAYLSMLKDKYIDKLEKKTNSETVLKLKKKLETKTKRGNTSVVDGGNSNTSGYDVFASYASNFLKKPI